MEERITVGVNDEFWEIMSPEYEQYIINIVKMYRTTYDLFAIVGDKIIGSDYAGFFCIEIGPIQNTTNILFGFTLRSVDKELKICRSEIALNNLICLYNKIYNNYINYKPLYHNDVMIEMDGFMNMNNHKAGVKAGLFNVEDPIIISTMNGTYIKINKNDTLTLNIYQDQLMQIEGKQFFEYILYKKKSNLRIKFYTLQLALGYS